MSSSALPITRLHVPLRHHHQLLLQQQQQHVEQQQQIAQLQQQPQLEHKYQVLKVLRTGSMSVLRRAKHRQTGAAVVVKSYRDKVEAASELQLLQLQLQHHRNICHVHQVIHAGSSVHLVMDFYASSLPALLALHPRGLPPLESRRLAAQMLQALVFMHEQQVAFLSLKPSSVMLAEPEGAAASGSVVKLIHFKRARSLRRQSAVLARYDSPELLRHCSYDAPELLAGDSCTSAADIWSFGCVLAEMLTGQPIFPGSSPAEVLQRIFRLLGLPTPRLSSLINKRRALKAAVNAPAEDLAAGVQERLSACQDAELLRLLWACLAMEPSQRPTALQLLQSQSFASFAMPAAHTSHVPPAGHANARPPVHGRPSHLGDNVLMGRRDSSAVPGLWPSLAEEPAGPSLRRVCSDDGGGARPHYLLPSTSGSLLGALPAAGAAAPLQLPPAARLQLQPSSLLCLRVTDPVTTASTPTKPNPDDDFDGDLSRSSFPGDFPSSGGLADTTDTRQPGRSISADGSSLQAGAAQRDEDLQLPPVARQPRESSFAAFLAGGGGRGGPERAASDVDVVLRAAAKPAPEPAADAAVVWPRLSAYCASASSPAAQLAGQGSPVQLPSPQSTVCSLPALEREPQLQLVPLAREPQVSPPRANAQQPKVPKAAPALPPRPPRILRSTSAAAAATPGTVSPPSRRPLVPSRTMPLRPTLTAAPPSQLDRKLHSV